MFEEQEIVEIAGEELLVKVRHMSDEGYRLVQISCTQDEAFTIDYTFDKDYKFLNFRMKIPVENAELPSITGIYGCAFTYENELHDLFGINVHGISLNYSGNFYRIPVVAPFNIPGKKQDEKPEETTESKE